MFSKKKFFFLLILLFPINLFANQFEKNIEKLGLTLSGHYIDETMKNENGKYVLPSRDWMKKNVNNDRAIFFREGGRDQRHFENPLQKKTSHLGKSS